MCFTLGLLDLVPNKLPEHTQQHPQSSGEKICCPTLYVPLILTVAYVLSWLFLLVFHGDAASVGAYICQL